ncbi:MAG: hypothetical protein CSA97_05860, partial [Bacteroidetes bacterium]
MLLLLVGSSLLTYCIILGIVIGNLRSREVSNSKQHLLEVTSRHAQAIEQVFARYMTLNHAIIGFGDELTHMPQDSLISKELARLRRILRGQDQLQGLYMMWDQSHFNPLDTGLLRVFLWREGQEVKDAWDVITMRTPSPGSLWESLDTQNSSITEPYIMGNPDGTELLMVSTESPIVANGRMVGTVGEDINLSTISELLSNLRPTPNSQAMLISHAGNIIVHPDPELIGKPLEDRPFGNMSANSIMANLKNAIAITESEEQGEIAPDVWTIFIPIRIGNTKTPWGLCVNVPHSDLYAKTRRVILMLLLLAAAGIIALSLITYAVATRITRRVMRAVTFAEGIGKGYFNATIGDNNQDEVGIMLRTLEGMGQNLANSFNQIDDGTQNIHSSSEFLSQNAERLAGAA